MDIPGMSESPDRKAADKEVFRLHEHLQTKRDASSTGIKHPREGMKGTASTELGEGSGKGESGRKLPGGKPPLKLPLTAYSHNDSFVLVSEIPKAVEEKALKFLQKWTQREAAARGVPRLPSTATTVRRETRRATFVLARKPGRKRQPWLEWLDKKEGLVRLRT